jgi:hypothetical protein
MYIDILINPILLSLIRSLGTVWRLPPLFSQEGLIKKFDGHDREQVKAGAVFMIRRCEAGSEISDKRHGPRIRTS